MIRYVAFFMVTGSPVGVGASPQEALDNATAGADPLDRAFVEVLDCGDDHQILLRPTLLHEARGRCKTVFRGDGYPHLEPIALPAPGQERATS